MDATDQTSIAGDHQLHEGLAEGTAVRRRLIFRPYRACSDCLLVVAGNCPTGRPDLGCRCQLCLCLVCIGHGHMVGKTVARELMAGRHHRMDCRVQPDHLHRRNRVYCPSVGPMNRPLGRRPVTLLAQALRMLDWPADLAIDDMPGPREEVLRHRLRENAVRGHDKYGSRRSTPRPQATVQSLSAKTPASMAGTRAKTQDVGPMSRRTAVTARCGMRARIVRRDGWRTPLVGVASQPGTRVCHGAQVAGRASSVITRRPTGRVRRCLRRACRAGSRTQSGTTVRR
jgi:hypothetical protein